MSDEALSFLWVGVAAGLVLSFGNAAAHRWGSARLREWAPVPVLVASLVGPLAVAITQGLEAMFLFCAGLLGGLAVGSPLVLSALGIDAVVRRRRGKEPVELPPPTRTLGRPIAYLRPGVGFFPRPAWTRSRRLRDSIAIDGELVEVERGAGKTIRELLALDHEGLPRGGTRWYEVYETGDTEWPALVVHVGAIQNRMVARVSSIQLAHRLAALLTATTNERNRVVKSPRYWFRTPL